MVFVPDVELSLSISLLTKLIQTLEAMGKGKLHKCSLEDLSCLTIAELKEMGLDGTPWSKEMVRFEKLSV